MELQRASVYQKVIDIASAKQLLSFITRPARSRGAESNPLISQFPRRPNNNSEDTSSALLWSARIKQVLENDKIERAGGG